MNIFDKLKLQFYNIVNYFQKASMQRQLKKLDEQLVKNSLIRLTDPLMKGENSLFRAVSLSIFHNINQQQKIISYLKLALLCNMTSLNNPFPEIPNRTKYLRRFRQNKNLINDYIQNPDLACFQKENLELISIVFDSKVSLFTINGQDTNQYLQEITVSLGSSSMVSGRKKLKNIQLARVGNRYFCVFTQHKNKMINFIKQYIGYQLLNNLTSINSSNSINSNTSKEGKVHFPSFEETHIRPHKKSLSDCGDLLYEQLQNMESINLMLNRKNTQYTYDLSHNHNNNHQNIHMQNHHPMFAINSYLSQEDQQYFTQYNGNYQSYNNEHHHQSLYQYPVPNSPMYPPQNHFTLCNNVRYSGRLKFFDQNKKYGFIVVDDINEDLFVHLDDLSKAGMNKQSLKNSTDRRFQFTCLEYDGKYKKSKKAVELVLLNDY